MVNVLESNLLESVVFEDHGMRTVLFRLSKYIPERGQDGSRLFVAMPHYEEDSVKAELYGPPPPTGRKIVLLHPNNYIAFADVAALNRVVLMEWRIPND